MKRKILFNIAFCIQFIIALIFLIYFCKSLIDIATSYISFLTNKNTTFYVEKSYFINNIIKDVVFIICIIFIAFLSIYLLVYINKNDITELAKSTKENRLQKSEEKKQQQIKELEEKLKQLKKDE